MVPRLTTALAGPLQDLEHRILERTPEIERCLRTQWQEHALPLHASAAQFIPLAFESPCIPNLDEPAGCPPNRFYAYGVVARLAQLAASIEIEELEIGAATESVAA